MTITTAQFIAVNVGTSPNDGTGDDLRDAFIKVNNSFSNITDIGFNAGNISADGAIEVIGNITTSSSLIATNLYGLIQTPTQSQITSLGILTGANISGITNITNTTNALQFNSGALVVNGGVGIAKDVYIQGNLYVANAFSTTVSALTANSSMIFFDGNTTFPYNFDIGFYGEFTGGVGNLTQLTGFIRNDTDGVWNLFSNVTPSIITTQMPLTNAKYDKLVLGNITINAPTPTAITNGGTTATGNIGASGATFNYGYFTNLTGTLQTAAQNNITSLGTLTSLAVTGNISGTLTTASQPNITSLGTLTSLTSTGSIIGGELFATNRSGDEGGQLNLANAVTNTTLIGNIIIDVFQNRLRIWEGGGTNRGGYFDLSVANASIGTNFATGSGGGTPGGGNTQIQFNDSSTFSGSAAFTFNKTSNVVTMSGNLTAGNVGATYFTGNGSLLTSLTAGNLAGTIPSAVLGNSTLYIGTTAITLNRASLAQSLTGVSVDGSAVTVTGAAQANITSVGTLSGLTVSGAITVNSGASATAIINGATTGVGNIGSSTVGFNTIFAKSTSAEYADLAENYLSDADYDAGTVVVFGGDKEITTTQLFADTAVAGVISTNPAYLMNTELDGQPVALRGRVPVKVQGFTRKGDLLVTGNIPGVAVSVGRDASYGPAVFAKALENKTTTDIGVIEAVII